MGGSPSAVERCRRLIGGKDYASLKAQVASMDNGGLLAVWRRLRPLERLLLFKLLPAGRAMNLFEALDFEQKYFLFCGFDRGAIAPSLEGLPKRIKASFTSLPESCYDEMLRLLAQERGEDA